VRTGTVPRHQSCASKTISEFFFISGELHGVRASPKSRLSLFCLCLFPLFPLLDTMTLPDSIERHRDNRDEVMRDAEK
jgi:hypothetical protein